LLSNLIVALNIQQGVALTGRNRTGPPCSVGQPTAHVPAAGPPAGSVTDDDRRLTPARNTTLAATNKQKKLVPFIRRLTVDFR